MLHAMVRTSAVPVHIIWYLRVQQQYDTRGTWYDITAVVKDHAASSHSSSCGEDGVFIRVPCTTCSPRQCHPSDVVSRALRAVAASSRTKGNVLLLSESPDTCGADVRNAVKC